MENRREFLASAAALAATLFVRSGKAEEDPPAPRINETLATIQSKLRQLPEVAEASLHRADRPTKGLVQWRWPHFRADMDASVFELVEKGNAELLAAMRAVHDIPDSGLHELMHEGIFVGTESHGAAANRQIHRELVEEQMTVRSPFTFSARTPSARAVNVEMRNFAADRIQRPFIQYAYTEDGDIRRLRISPLGRLGVGYFLSAERGVKLLGTEDPDVFEKARLAELSGSPEEIRRWIHDERDLRYKKIAEQSRNNIVHLLLGYGHVLTDDLAIDNEQGGQFSHLIVTVKSLIPKQEIPDAPALPEDVPQAVELAPMRH